MAMGGAALKHDPESMRWFSGKIMLNQQSEARLTIQPNLIAL
jgi:hypothetical protein